jgi:hypothetical protein
MIVYVVTSCPQFADTDVEGVFSSIDLANEWIAGFHPTYNMEVHAREVDASVPAPHKGDGK